MGKYRNKTTGEIIRAEYVLTTLSYPENCFEYMWELYDLKEYADNHLDGEEYADLVMNDKEFKDKYEEIND